MIKKRRKYISNKIYIRRTRSVSKKCYTSFIVAIIMIVLSTIFMKLGLEVEKNINPIYQYKIERKSDYEVLLNENDFYSTKILPSDLYYASKSINVFIINFEYNFKGKSKIDTECNYNVTAELVGNVKDEYLDKEVWNKNFSIIENKTIKQSDTETFSIKEDIDIDYKKYNDLVHSYENTYGFKIDAVLKIKFNIVYQINLSNYIINTEKKEDLIELDIPITNTITEVKENYENEDVVNILPPIEEIRTRKNIYYAIAGFFMISAIIIFKIGISKNRMTPQEKYEKKVNHILKYYRDIIVTIKNEPNLTDLKIMELITLDDLIDVAEQNNCNIIHYEDLKKGFHYLYVIVEECVYCYKIIFS